MGGVGITNFALGVLVFSNTPTGLLLLACLLVIYFSYRCSGGPPGSTYLASSLSFGTSPIVGGYFGNGGVEPLNLAQILALLPG